MPKVSIVIPVLDEVAALPLCLGALQSMRERGCELIVVDGGSRDGTPEVARSRVDLLVEAPRGRARQMNAGAQRAGGEVIWFMHADSLAPADGDVEIQQAITDGYAWGRFDVKLSGRHPGLRIIAGMMNWRSRFTGIATGDQGLFVRADLFSSVGGYPDIDLMEDIALSKTLKRHESPVSLRSRIAVSSRRWERDGVLRTVLTMWRLRAGYWMGESPETLSRIYYGRRS